MKNKKGLYQINPVNEKFITPKHDFSWYIKWTGTICYIFAAICAAGAWLPWNYVGSLIGASLWCWVGVLWHDRALMILNAFTAAMMTTAIITWSTTLS